MSVGVTCAGLRELAAWLQQYDATPSWVKRLPATGPYAAWRWVDHRARLAGKRKEGEE